MSDHYHSRRGQKERQAMRSLIAVKSKACDAEGCTEDGLACYDQEGELAGRFCFEHRQERDFCLECGNQLTVAESDYCRACAPNRY